MHTALSLLFMLAGLFACLLSGAPGQSPVCWVGGTLLLVSALAFIRGNRIQQARAQADWQTQMLEAARRR